MTEFEKSLQSICDNMVRSASYAISYLDENKRQKALDTLRENIEDYVKSAKTLKSINALMNQSLTKVTNTDQTRLIEEFNQQTTSFIPDASDSEHLKDYDKCIEKLMKTIAGVQVNSEDAEMEITDEGMGNYANLVCPISKIKMTEPMENTICGHIYDKSSLAAILKSNNHTRCPIVGCQNKEYLNASHLKPDIVTRICMEACSE